MGTSNSKWDWATHGNLRCDECSQIIEFSEEQGYASDCKACHRELVKLHILKDDSSETPVALGKPERIPSLRQIQKIQKVSDSAKDLGHKIEFIYFTCGDVYLSIPSALRVKKTSGRHTLYINILSEVTLSLSRLEDDRITVHLKDLICLNSWPVLPTSMPYRMNRLSHGPQRHYRTSAYKSDIATRIKIRGSYKHFEVRAGYERLLKTDSTDKLIVSEIKNSNEIKKNEINLSESLIMWTSVLLEIVHPSKGICDYVSDDRLIALSFYFTVPMVDRSGVLNASSCLRLKVLDPLPDFDPAYDSIPIDKIINDRSREIIKTSQKSKKDICILWSGGIDSTAVAISFLKSCADLNDPPMLFIGITSVAIAEYPTFYSEFLLKYESEKIISFVCIDEEIPLSMQLDLDRYIYVTGECGDQLFGSDIMANAFSVEELENQFSYSAPPNPSPRHDHHEAYRHKEGLNAPWEETFLKSLVAAGLEKNPAGWKQWIQPLLDKSPVKIITTFDILWWLNITLKWQHVVLRIFNFRKELKKEDFNSVDHFFRTDDFQKWSFANHENKLPDKSNWATYKQPLKQYIFDYTKDEYYFKNKLKCGSLGCVMPPTSGQNDMLGIDSNLNLITHGVSSVLVSGFNKKYGNSIHKKYIRPLSQRVGSLSPRVPRALPEN